MTIRVRFALARKTLREKAALQTKECSECPPTIRKVDKKEETYRNGLDCDQRWL